jgi:hypothetical protein
MATRDITGGRSAERQMPREHATEQLQPVAIIHSTVDDPSASLRAMWLTN